MLPDPNYLNLDDTRLLALCIWREASNQSFDAKVGVGCCIRNRIAKGGWWGHDWRSVILKPFQFSSFNKNDSNSNRWPNEGESSWLESLEAASLVKNANIADNTDGCTSYYDKSLDNNKPKWAATMVHVKNICDFRFYKRTQD